MSQVGGLTIELAWPPPQLSPNARVHHMEKYRFQKAAKDTTYWVTKSVLGRDKFDHDGGDIGVVITAHPPAGKVAPDDDNLLASLKSQLDGIALALGVNDKHFRPSLQWAEPCKPGKIIVCIGAPCSGKMIEA